MAASVELEEESLDRQVQDDSDGDATWSDPRSDRPTVRSQPLYMHLKFFDKGYSGEDAPLERKERKMTNLLVTKVTAQSKKQNDCVIS
jgi:hypothetical protein